MKVENLPVFSFTSIHRPHHLVNNLKIKPHSLHSCHPAALRITGVERDNVLQIMFWCHSEALEKESQEILGEASQHLLRGSWENHSRSVSKAHLSPTLNIFYFHLLSSSLARDPLTSCILLPPYQTIFSGDPLENSFGLNHKLHEGTVTQVSQGCWVFKKAAGPPRMHFRY